MFLYIIFAIWVKDGLSIAMCTFMVTNISYYVNNMGNVHVLLVDASKLAVG